MLKISKKALGTYIVVIAILGLFITFFLMFILETAYTQDPQSCEAVDYSVAFCIDNRYEVTLINNNAEIGLNLRVNGDTDVSKYLTPAGDRKTIYLDPEVVGSNIELTPIVTNSAGNPGVCNTKTINRATNIIGRC